MKDSTDKQGTLLGAEEGKLDDDKHMYTIQKKPQNKQTTKHEPVEQCVQCLSHVLVVLAQLQPELFKYT